MLIVQSSLTSPFRSSNVNFQTFPLLGQKVAGCVTTRCHYSGAALSSPSNKRKNTGYSKEETVRMQ